MYSSSCNYSFWAFFMDPDFPDWTGYFGRSGSGIRKKNLIGIQTKGPGSETLLIFWPRRLALPGCPLLCCAAPGHVNSDEELHVLAPLPGEVVHGEQQHV